MKADANFAEADWDAAEGSTPAAAVVKEKVRRRKPKPVAAAAAGDGDGKLAE